MNILKATEDSLFTHMAVLNTQMGANLRAFPFLRNQELLGMKSVGSPFWEVKEVIDRIVEWKRVSLPSMPPQEMRHQKQQLRLSQVHHKDE